MKPTDDGILARFAGGDMSIAEEVEFLARCEIEPDLWRAAALALVEHRQLVAALREFAGDRNTRPIEAARPPMGNSKVSWPRLGLVAASLFAVFLGGLSVAYWTGRHQRNDVQQVHRDLPKGESAVTGPSVFVCLQTPSGPEEMGATQVPWPTVSSPATATAHLAAVNARPVFPAEARSLIRQVGFEVEEEPLLYVFDGDDGDRWAVPARNYRLRYVNHEE